MKIIFVFFFFFNRQKKSALSIKLALKLNYKHDSKSGCFPTVKRIGAYIEGVRSLIMSPVLVITRSFFSSGRQRLQPFCELQ